MENPDILHGWLAAQGQADLMDMDPGPGLARRGLHVAPLNA